MEADCNLSQNYSAGMRLVSRETFCCSSSHVLDLSQNMSPGHEDSSARPHNSTAIQGGGSILRLGLFLFRTGMCTSSEVSAWKSSYIMSRDHRAPLVFDGCDGFVVVGLIGLVLNVLLSVSEGLGLVVRKVLALMLCCWC